jgi:hypothetical protein
MMSLVCLGGCLAFAAALLANGPLGAGKLRPSELLPSPVETTPAAPPDAGQQIVYDLATLPPEEAIRLQGRRELYRVRLDSAEAEVGGRLVYEVVVRDPDALGTVWLTAGQGVKDVLTVEAGLKVVYQRTAVGGAGGRPSRVSRSCGWGRRCGWCRERAALCLHGGRKRVG